MSRSANTLPCTICAWYAEDTPAMWRALSPASTWHYLCDAHYTQFAGKYTQHHTLTPELIHRLTTSGVPFGKRIKQ